MTKSEIIAAVAEKASCTKKDAEKCFSAVIDTITEACQMVKKLQSQASVLLK